MIDESPRKRVHNLSDGTHEVMYECEYCQKMFVTPAQLTGEYALVLSLPIYFTDFLLAHRWHHTKPFQCEKCMDRFSAKGNLVGMFSTPSN